MAIVTSADPGHQSPAERLPDRPTLLYDDGCRFCRAMAELLSYAARRRELAFLPWSAETALAWMESIPAEVRDQSMHLKLPDGALVSGNPVLAATLGHVRGLAWVSRLCDRVPVVARGLAGGYGFVARHRDVFSRIVPDRPAVVRVPSLR